MSARPPVPTSVVVPVRDEAATVGVLVASLERQTRRPAEVIFVDGGSTDDTPAIIEGLTADEPRFRVIRAGAATPGRGRNVGIEQAAHEWVALTDAGIELDDHWLDRLVRVVEHEPDLDIAYGSYEPAAGSFLTLCAAIAYVQALRLSPRGPVRDGSIASVLLRKEAWRQAGGFADLRAAEDGHLHENAPPPGRPCSVRSRGPGKVVTGADFRSDLRQVPLPLAAQRACRRAGALAPPRGTHVRGRLGAGGPWPVGEDPRPGGDVRDNLATHKTPAVHAWLLRHRRFHFHVTPTYGSWMNIWSVVLGVDHQEAAALGPPQRQGTGC